jgi:hypothetical protein
MSMPVNEENHAPSQPGVALLNQRCFLGSSIQTPALYAFLAVLDPKPAQGWKGSPGSFFTSQNRTTCHYTPGRQGEGQSRLFDGLIQVNA